jgi:subtilase family serine protease
MHLSSLLSGLGLCCVLAGAQADAAPHGLMTRHVPPAARAENFVAPVPAGQMLMLAIALPLHREKLLDQFLDAVQDPRSPSYRHYLSVAEFTRNYGPTEAEYGALRQFADANGLRIVAEAPNRFVMDVAAPAATIEKAFGIKLGIYRQPDGQRVFFAPDREPRMDIGVSVLHIAGLDNAAPPRPRAQHRVDARASSGARVQKAGTGPNGDYTGTDIRVAYVGNTSLIGTGQTVALIEFAGYGYNITDVQNYFSSLGQKLSVPVVGISVDGSAVSCTGSCNDFEPSIDIEQSIAMAPGLKQVSFYIGATVIDILNRIATDNTAKQISSSYGWPADPATENPVYKEFAAQGQSFVDGSGDDGADLQDGGVWPADSEYVTGVGGTDLTTQSNGAWYSETAWVYSGGGTSPDKIGLPRWQKGFINANNLGSSKLRNVPDVAAEANYDNYVCYQGGCSGGNGGTSFSAPRWAGFVALVNQQAMATKGSPVGFLNKTMYALAKGGGYGSQFHDVANGNNGTYDAVASFDLVTGLGTPQVALINALAGSVK